VLNIERVKDFIEGKFSIRNMKRERRKDFGEER